MARSSDQLAGDPESIEYESLLTNLPKSRMPEGNGLRLCGWKADLAGIGRAHRQGHAEAQEGRGRSHEKGRQALREGHEAACANASCMQAALPRGG